MIVHCVYCAAPERRTPALFMVELVIRFVVILALRNCGGEKPSAQFVEEPLRESLNSYKPEFISDQIFRFATETPLQSLT